MKKKKNLINNLNLLLTYIVLYNLELKIYKNYY